MFRLRIITFFVSVITVIFMFMSFFSGKFTLSIILLVLLIVELLAFDLRRIYIKDKIIDKTYKNSK